MRYFLVFSLVAMIFGCRKQDPMPENELPLSEVRGKILCTTGSDLVEMDLQGGSAQKVGAGWGTYSAAWSPNGQWLLWGDHTNSGGALVYKVTDTLGSIIFEFNNPDIHDPCWSPDGTRIAFFNYEKKIVTKIDVITGERDSFKFNVGYTFWQQGNPDWSPDGSTFVFSAFETDKVAFNLWRIDADGQHLSRLTDDGAYFARWSPDGKQIAFATSQGLKVMSPEGNNVKLLIAGGGTPQWSASGKLMMYTICDDPGQGSKGCSIHVRNLETGQERLLLGHASLLYWHSLE